MKKLTLLFISCLICGTSLFAQDDSASPEKKWNFSTDINLYFIPADFFVLPVFRADKNKLHLEARYNYEERETFSAWVGYNFTGGENFEYAFTPMVGGVVGLSNGMAPGLEMTLGWKRLELYSEAEYVFDFVSTEYNFLYNWTDITYSPKDWLWLGISGQRTRLYQTDLDIQRGFLIGAGLEHWELTTYMYNLGFDEPFFLVMLTANF